MEKNLGKTRSFGQLQDSQKLFFLTGFFSSLFSIRSTSFTTYLAIKCGKFHKKPYNSARGRGGGGVAVEEKAKHEEYSARFLGFGNFPHMKSKIGAAGGCGVREEVNRFSRHYFKWQTNIFLRLLSMCVQQQ